MKLTNVTKLGWHLMLPFGIVDIKAYLGLQRSDDLNLVYDDLRVQDCHENYFAKSHIIR